MNGAVFLDRDGTLIEEVGYLDRKERVELYPYATDAIRALNQAGVPIVMVTNQSGVARGFFTEAVVEDVHRHIAALLARGGARIDGLFYGVEDANGGTRSAAGAHLGPKGSIDVNVAPGLAAVASAGTLRAVHRRAGDVN